jgi:hypothetical protein
MGVLIEGAWRDGELPQETGASGEFRRADSRFRDRITADGSTAPSLPWLFAPIQVISIGRGFPLITFSLAFAAVRVLSPCRTRVHRREE